MGVRGGDSVREGEFGELKIWGVVEKRAGELKGKIM